MFKSRLIEFVKVEGQVQQVGPLPWVTRFTQRYIVAASSEYLPTAMGYRPIQWDVEWLVGCYARPWWVWRLLKWFPCLITRG